MKKFLTLFCLAALVAFLPQSAMASNWLPVEGTPGIFWNAEDLKYVRDESGNKVEGDLVVVLIKRPMPADVLDKIISAQTDEAMKKELKNVTSEVRSYCFSLKNNVVSFTGNFLVGKDDKIYGYQETVSEFVPIPAKTENASAVPSVFEYLQKEAAANNIK